MNFPALRFTLCLASLLAVNASAVGPLAHTSAATSIRTNSATLNGFAVPNDQLSTAWFEWGLRGSFTQMTVPTDVGAGYGVVYLNPVISNLTERATFQYRLVVSNSLGVSYGALQLFSTGSRVSAWGFNLSGQTTVPANLTNAVTVTGGGSHSLALRSDGTLTPWGKYYNGSAEVPMFVPAGLSNVAMVAAGTYHNLALLTNRTVSAWGSVWGGSAYVAATVPADLTNVVSLSATYHNLALRADGLVKAWGDNGSGQTNVPAGLSNVVEIATGQNFSLALEADGTVVAWGNYYNGSGLAPLYVPVGLTDVTAIAGASHAAVALRSDGTVVAWGYAGYNQTNLPPGLTNIIAVTGGNTFCAALRADGTVIVWGSAGYEVNNVPAGLNALGVTSGQGHVLALGNLRPQVQSQTVSSLANADLQIILSGSDGNGDPLSFRITALPAVGTLFQFDPNTAARGLAITSAGTLVSDPGRRVIFAPATNGFGSPYTTFDFTATDGVDDSTNGTVTVNIVADPHAFTQAPLAVRATSATLHGMAFAKEISGSAWFEWGPRGVFDHSSPTTPVSGSNVLHLTQPISNLTAGATYQCRMVVSNLTGIHFGPMQLFTTGNRISVWGQYWNGTKYVRMFAPPGLTNLVAVAGGGGFNVGQRADGTVVAWGANANGETNVPPGLGNVAAVAAGDYHAVALRADGTVVAWGANSEGQTNVPPGLSNVVALAAGGYHTLALRSDGTVVAWGNNLYNQTNVPGLDKVVTIAAGTFSSVVLQADGNAFAWGYGGLGAISLPDDLTNAVGIAQGDSHGIALRNDATVTGWGWNGYGQAVPPPGLSNVVAVATGDYHSLALRADGTVVAWGDDSENQSTVPAALTNAATISGGSYHSIALADNAPPLAESQIASGPANHDLLITLTGFDPNGDPLNFRIASLPAVGTLYQNNSGARGATISNTNTPVTDPGGRVFFVPVTNGYANAYAAFDFVANDGQFDSPPATVTIQVTGAAYGFTQPALPVSFSNATVNAAVIANGFDTTVWFEWGVRGGFNQTTPPVTLLSGGEFNRVSANLTNLVPGASFQFRVVASNAASVVYGALQWFTTGSRLVGWGANYNGMTDAPPDLGNTVAIAAGNSHSVALRPDGTMLAWGSSDYGQTNVPPGLSNIVGVAAGSAHTLALRSDGTVLAWGLNDYGQTNVPAGLSNVIALAGGNSHSLALLTNGSVVAWGMHNPGEGLYPVTPPSGVTDIVGIAAGGAHSLALRADGTVIAWGDNYYGQLNVPSDLNDVVAIAAGGSQNLVLKSNGTLVAWPNYGATAAGFSNVVVIECGWYHSGLLNAAGIFSGWGNNSSGQTIAPAGLSNLVALAAGGFHNLALVGNDPPVAQSQFVSGPVNADLVVTLSGSDTNGDALTFRVTTLPAVGTLYQYNAGVRGVAITNAGTLVTDAGRRVIFAPVPLTVGDPYDSFSFVANDGVVDSAPATVTVSLIAAVSAFTRPATVISPTSAQLNGFVAPKGFPATTWFEWGTNTTYGQTTSPTNIGAVSTAAHVTQTIAGLNGGGTIHFRLVASNASAVVFGADQQFLPGGKAAAWGDNSSGQSALPPNLGSVGAVVGGLSHSLALRTDGTVKAWGNNTHGQTNIPSGLNGVAALAAGGFHNLALCTNGSVVAWGRNNFAQTNVLASASNVVAVAAGGQHSVALRADGSLVAWGDNSQGQRVVPASLSNVVGLAVGWYHNVALRSDGTVAAWGANAYGQSTVPAGLTNVVWVGAGLYHSLALRSDGTMAAWGLNSSGQGVVPAAMTNIVAAAGGGSHNLVLRSSNTFTGWGYNFYGQATPPASLSNAVTIAAGGSHSLAIVPNHLPVASNQIVAGYPNTDLLITLTGSDADNDALSYRITTLPGLGALYQFVGGTRGTQIVLADTAVSDANARVIFAPALNQTGSPHATFSFVANDGTADSAPAQVTINIILPAAPSLNLAASGVITNGVFQLAFTGATNANYRVWASTNLLNWELLGTAASPSPGQFLFFDTSATNWPQRFYRATAP